MATKIDLANIRTVPCYSNVVNTTAEGRARLSARLAKIATGTLRALGHKAKVDPSTPHGTWDERAFSDVVCDAMLARNADAEAVEWAVWHLTQYRGVQGRAAKIIGKV